MIVVAGIDVSKATLEVSVSEGPVLRFENSATGIRRLLRHLERAGVTKAVCEFTGGYERLVVGKLRETVIGVEVAHPVRVRAFARACGYEAKTDPLDAQVLSRYGVVFSESDTTQPDVDPDRGGAAAVTEQAASTCRAAGAGAQPTGQGRKCERREVDQAARPLAGQRDRAVG